MPPALFHKDLPKHRLHKASRLGVVTLDRKDHYLGAHGTPQSVEAYHRLIRELSTWKFMSWLKASSPCAAAS